MNASSAKIVHIEIVSDVMCPWCYVGKRRLEKAVKMLGPDISVKINWKPYQLDSSLPQEGKNRQQYLSEKFGNMQNADKIYDAIRQAGKDENIPFAFEAIKVSPNTLDAHRLIAWAGEMGHHRQERIVEILFESYFIKAKNIGDHAVLTELATKAGMDPHDISEKLKSDELVAEIRNEIDMVHQIGVTGVPCFILEKKYAISGAQNPDTLAKAIMEIASNEMP